MKVKYISAMLLGGIALLASCTKDLDVKPLNKDDLSSGIVYDTPGAYYQVLAKCYGSFALTGNEGPAGRGDVAGIDEGTSHFTRLLFYLQEGTTDEALIAWGDPGVADIHNLNWSADNTIIQGLYYRLYYTVSLTNELVRATNGKAALSSEIQDNLPLFNAEARFLRAYAYYNLLDLFGNVPFVTEKDGVGAFNPDQIKRADLFKYVEEQLLALENENLLPVKPSQYGRVGMSAVHFLLARLYLNAKVYTGTERYADCANYSSKVIADGYSLAPSYSNNFLSDNNTSPELIFAVTQDGINTKSYGGSTFLTNGAYGGTGFDSQLFGMNGTWQGPRATSALVRKFFANPASPTAAELADKRGTSDNNQTKDLMFWSKNKSLEISNIGDFAQGWSVVKFKNISSASAAGKPVKGQNGDFADTDVPLFRLADAYLMYAEAAARGAAGASKSQAVQYVNEIRSRAGITTPLTEAQLTPQFILDERSRELFWECTRRTDLIRYDQFTTGTYVWPWKGNVAVGSAVNEKYNIFPIPASDKSANPKLEQNPGY